MRLKLLAMLIVPLSLVACKERDHNEGADPNVFTTGEQFGDGGRNLGRIANTQVLLTIDESPYAEGNKDFAGEISVYLKNQGIKAVFFLVGQRILNYPNSFEAILNNDHFVANHTMTHPLPFGSMTAQAQATEILNCHREIERRIGSRTRQWLHWFRAPGLSWDSSKASDVQRALSISSYRGPISFNIGKGKEDFNCKNTGKTAVQCGDGYFADLRSAGKGIALFHANQSLNGTNYSLDVIRQFVSKAKEAGYTFVTPSLELFDPR